MEGGSTEILKPTKDSRVGYQSHGSEASQSTVYFDRPGMFKDSPGPLSSSKQCGQVTMPALRYHLRGSSRKSHSKREYTAAQSKTVATQTRLIQRLEIR